jgi:hypothetical protein
VVTRSSIKRTETHIQADKQDVQVPVGKGTEVIDLSWSKLHLSIFIFWKNQLFGNKLLLLKHLLFNIHAIHSVMIARTEIKRGMLVEHVIGASEASAT